MFFHCILASMITDEKSVEIWVIGTIHVLYRFSLAAIKLFSLCLVFSTLTMICLDVIFFVFILRVTNLESVHLCLHLMEILRHYIFFVCLFRCYLHDWFIFFSSTHGDIYWTDIYKQISTEQPYNLFCILL